MAENQGDQDFYKEFKDRMNMDPLRDVMENRKATNHTLIIIFAVITGILVSSLIGWYVIGNLMVKKTGNINSIADIPTVHSPLAPIKIKPEDEGGMKIANQEKKVYDLIGKNSEGISREKVISTKTTAVAPAEEEFLDSDDNYGEEVKDEIGKEGDDIEKQPVEVTDKPVKMSEPEKKVEEKKVEEVKSAEVLPKETPKTEEVKTETKAEAKVEEKKEVKATEPVNVSNKNMFKVQILSTKNEAQAKGDFKRLVKKFPDLKNIKNEIEKADLGAKGIYYRLKIGEFKTREEASALCKKLKAGKQDCITTK